MATPHRSPRPTDPFAAMAVYLRLADTALVDANRGATKCRLATSRRPDAPRSLLAGRLRSTITSVTPGNVTVDAHADRHARQGEPPLNGLRAM